MSLLILHGIILCYNIAHTVTACVKSSLSTTIKLIDNKVLSLNVLHKSNKMFFSNSR